MNTTKRFLIFLACLLALTTGVCAAEGTISDFRTDCTVLKNGSCEVTQTVTVNITGLAQDLVFPLGTDVKKGTVAGYHAKKTTQDGCVVLTLHNDAGFSGSRTFTVQYTLDHLIEEADGIQTLTLPMLFPKWEYPIDRYSFTVSLPDPFESMPAFQSGYYGDVIEDYMDFTVSDGLVRGTLNGGLLDHESLIMTLDVESGYFSGTYASWSVGWIAAVLIILGSALTLLYWMLTLRCPYQRSPARPMPPDAVLPCDLPLLLAGAKPDFNMLVCHWAQLGYLTITVTKNGHVRLQKRVEMSNERRRLEQKLFAALFIRGETCDGESLVYKRAAQPAASAIPNYWNRRLYEKNSGSPAVMRLMTALVGGLALFSVMSLLLPVMSLRWLLLVVSFFVGILLSVLVQLAPQSLILHRRTAFVFSAAAAVVLLLLSNLAGSFLLMLLAVALSVVTGILTLHGGKRSASGVQFIGQISGFRRYLKNLDEKQLPPLLYRDGQYYYRLLPYAEAMGLGLEFSRKFGDLELEPCDWYAESKPLPRTAEAFYEHFSAMLDTLSLSIKK